MNGDLGRSSGDRKVRNIEPLDFAVAVPDITHEVVDGRVVGSDLDTAVPDSICARCGTAITKFRTVTLWFGTVMLR